MYYNIYLLSFNNNIVSRHSRNLEWLGEARPYAQSMETNWVYVPTAVASYRMDDHPGILATSLLNIHKH